MAYQINKTNGTIIASVPDGQIDTLSTDLTLIGKNYSNYGDELNENFVRLLENFADSTRPSNPILGQLWFDTTDSILKIYSGTSFVPISSTEVSESQPPNLRTGDLWFNDIDKQLYFFDGNDLVLVSPIYRYSQGKCGFEVQTVADTLNQTRIVTMLYNSGALIGIFAKDSFTPKLPITGFTGSISPGFNMGDIAGAKFDVTCTNAEQLGGISASSFLRTDVSNVLNGQLTINSDQGLIVGNPGNSLLSVQNGSLILSNLNVGKNLTFTVTQGIDNEPAINITPNDRTIRLYEGYLDSQIEIGGNVNVAGSITVAGNVTTISSSELVVTDKNVTLGQVTDEEGNFDNAATTDLTAEGGGITLKGDTNKSLIWSADPTSSWTSSENFNLQSGKYYAINNYPLIQQIDPSNPTLGFKLTDHIKEIDGISIFGKREYIKIGPYPVEDQEWLSIENSTITTYDNHDLELAPNGNIVLTTDPVIKGLADPVDDQDAATKNYVDTQNKAQTIFLSTTLSDPNELIEADYYNLLNTMIPVGSVVIGTLVTLLCTIVQNTEVTVSANTNTSVGSFCLSDGFGQPSGSDAPAITTVGVEDIDVPAQPVTISRVIKTFRYEGTGWNLLTDVAWSPS